MTSSRHANAASFGYVLRTDKERHAFSRCCVWSKTTQQLLLDVEMPTAVVSVMASLPMRLSDHLLLYGDGSNLFVRDYRCPMASF